MWNVHIRKKLKGRHFFYNCLQISVNHIDRMSDSGLTCSLLSGEENGRHLREYYLFSAKIDMEELKIIGWCHYPYICVQIYIGTVFLNIPPKFFIVLYEVFIHIHRGWCEGWLWGEVCFLYHFWKPCILNYTADFLDKWKNIPPSPKQLKMSPDCRSYLGISQHLMISLCKSNLFSRSGLFIIWWQLQGMRKKWHTLSERDLFWEVREGEGFWAMNNGIPILYWTFIDLLG